MGTYTHFAQRCSDRGITDTESDYIFHTVHEAILTANTDIAEHVLDDVDGSFWRVMLDGYPTFYVVTGIGHGKARPKSVYTQEMMRQKKLARKSCKAGHIRRKVRLKGKRAHFKGRSKPR